MIRKTLSLAVALTLASVAHATSYDTPRKATAAAQQALIDAGAPAAMACINRSHGGDQEIVLIGTDSNGKTHYAELWYHVDNERYMLDVHDAPPRYLEHAAECQQLP